MGLPLVLLNRRRIGGFNPRAILAGSTAIAWFDPSDLTTMFQDAAGTTPVTAPAQPVGLVLDKSQGLVLGPELVTNGDFSAGSTGWTVPAGWSISGGVAVATAASGSLRGGGVTPILGRGYRVEFDVVSYTSGILYITVGGNFTGQGSLTSSGMSPGRKSIFVLSGSDAARGVEFYGGAVSATIDNISVRELPGFHATQSTAANRPTYGVVPSRGRVNLLTYSEQFDNAAWVKAAAGTGTAPTVTANAALAPDGTMTADRVDFNRGAGNTLSDRSTLSQSLSSSDNVSVVGSIYLKAATAGDVGKTIAVRTASASAYTQITLTADWVRFSNSGTTTVRTLEIASRGTVSTSNSVSVLIWGAQLELGATATEYQRVVSQFDVTDPVGFPSYPLHYLFFGGDLDPRWLQTSTITPNADKVQVFAGVRKLSDAAAQDLVTFGFNASGSFVVMTPRTSGVNSISWRAGGSVIALTDYSVAAPVTFVTTGLSDIPSDVLTLRYNGTQVAQSTADQGTGNFLAYPLFIGRRGGTSLAFNGNLYGLIVRFSTANLDASLINQTERWLAQKTGVTI